MATVNQIQNAQPGDKLSLVDPEANFARILGAEIREDDVTMEFTRNEAGGWDTTYLNTEVWTLDDPRGDQNIPTEEMVDPELGDIELLDYRPRQSAESNNS